MKNNLLSQLVPVKPSLQIHVYPFIFKKVVRQVPPFKQTFELAHCDVVKLHVNPEQPEKHVQPTLPLLSIKQIP